MQSDDDLDDNALLQRGQEVRDLPAPPVPMATPPLSGGPLRYPGTDTLSLPPDVMQRLEKVEEVLSASTTALGQILKGLGAEGHLALLYAQVLSTLRDITARVENIEKKNWNPRQTEVLRVLTELQEDLRRLGEEQEKSAGGKKGNNIHITIEKLNLSSTDRQEEDYEGGT